MSGDKKPIVIIDPKSSSMPAINPNSGLLSLIEALNPIGVIGKSLVEIMAYRVEAKRLRYEEIRVKEKSKVAQSFITSQLKVKLHQIENQRMALKRGLDFAEKNLYQSRVTRDALISSLENANLIMRKLVSRRDLPSPEVFEIFNHSIAEISGRLVEFENNNVKQAFLVNKHLLQIVGDARRDLLLPPNI
jgi:hypothetical protein